MAEDTLPDLVQWPLHYFPKIAVSGRFHVRERQFQLRHRHPTHAVHLYGYAARMHIGGRQLDLRPGDLTLTPAHCPSEYDMPEAGEHWAVHFLPSSPPASPPELPPPRQSVADPAALAVGGDAAGAAGGWIALPLHVTPPEDDQFAAEQLTRIATLWATGVSGDEAGRCATASASAALQELLLYLARQALLSKAAREVKQSDVALDQLIDLLISRISVRISVPALAREVGISQNYLAKVFRERTGMTIPSFMLSYRIMHADFLLRTTSSPVGEIAVAVGISNPHHFNKQFRRLTGRSPTQARQEPHDQWRPEGFPLAGGLIRLAPAADAPATNG